MRLSVLVGAGVLAVGASLAAQAPVLGATPALSIVFAQPTLSTAVAVVARESGVAIEFDDSVPAEIRSRQLAGPVSLVNAPLESVLKFLTGQNDLTFVVVDSATVRIQAKPQ